MRLPVAIFLPGESSLSQRALTLFQRTDNFEPERSRDENRSIDRILRGLKLHAKGRQFDGQNP